jgi:hypothetical protein
VQIVLFVALSEDTLQVVAAALILAVAAVLVWRESRLSSSWRQAASSGSLRAMPVAAGAWSYARQDILGMPVWLPLAYALFSVLVAYAGLSLSRMKR